MSRDDSVLYSGVTSASSGRKPTARQAQREKKEQDQTRLLPAADVVLELIATELTNVADIRSLIIDRKDTEQEVNTELLARKLYLGYLNSLESKIKSIMAVRVPKEPEAEDE